MFILIMHENYEVMFREFIITRVLRLFDTLVYSFRKSYRIFFQCFYSISVERSDRLFTEVQRSAKRLEILAEKRNETLKELTRIKALEDETNQVIVALRCALSRTS